MSIIIAYLTLAATSPYSKMVKSLFHRYFSFSNKVFYPVAYIMNGLLHLTTLTSLKFCWAFWYSFDPSSSKFGPSCPQFFSFGERDGDNFFRARANPEQPSITCNTKLMWYKKTSYDLEFSETKGLVFSKFCTVLKICWVSTWSMSNWSGVERNVIWIPLNTTLSVKKWMSSRLSINYKSQLIYTYNKYLQYHKYRTQ